MTSHLKNREIRHASSALLTNRIGGTDPVRRMPLRIVQKSLFCTHVISSIGCNGVAAPELIWHCLRRLAPSWLEARGRMHHQPEDMLLATVRLPSEPVAILLRQIQAKETQPHVLINRLPCPDCRRMLHIPDRLVAPLTLLRFRSRREIRSAENPVRRIKKLGSLQNHFDNMLVTMPTRTARWFVR